MRRINAKNKKGVSEIIGYALMIAMAVSMSAGIYAWLRTKVPKAVEKCPEDVSLEITSIEFILRNATIVLDLRNRGLFSVNGVTVRLKQGAKICKIRTLSCANCTRFVPGQDQVIFIQKLEPSEIRNLSVGYFTDSNTGCPYPTEIEIVPLRVVGEDQEAIISVCENAIFKEKLR